MPGATTSFKTTLAVPLHCESCVKEVSKSIYDITGVSSVEANLKEQTVAVEGIAALSAIVAAIQATGRDAILRGTGGSGSAAVCILETHSTKVTNQVRGLARMVQVAKNLTLVDLTIHGVSPGQYSATVRETGDITKGPASTGGIWEALKGKLDDRKEPRGVFGMIKVGPNGKGGFFIDRPIEVWELIGRSMVVSKLQGEKFDSDDVDTLVGVIARSAGVWDNDKTVCSCSGKTLWEERRETVSKGMR